MYICNVAPRCQHAAAPTHGPEQQAGMWRLALLLRHGDVCNVARRPYLVQVLRRIGEQEGLARVCGASHPQLRNWARLPLNRSLRASGTKTKTSGRAGSVNTVAVLHCRNNQPCFQKKVRVWLRPFS
jgi:hypothetical protein